MKLGTKIVQKSKVSGFKKKSDNKKNFSFIGKFPRQITKKLKEFSRQFIGIRSKFILKATFLGLSILGLYVIIPIITVEAQKLYEMKRETSYIQEEDLVNVISQLTLNTSKVNDLNQRNIDIEASFSKIDFRAFVFDEYFRINNSPLYGTGKTIVAACIKYGAPQDCMIIPAIAQNETHLCKYYNSAEMFNCWGFGGPAQYRRRFNSFDEAILLVYNVLVNQYGRRYIIDPTLMQSTFCGDEPGCAYWGNNIKSIQNSINNLSIRLGFPNLYSLR